jgi:hypothetical protein
MAEAKLKKIKRLDGTYVKYAERFEGGEHFVFCSGKCRERMVTHYSAASLKAVGKYLWLTELGKQGRERNGNYKPRRTEYIPKDIRRKKRQELKAQLKSIKGGGGLQQPEGPAPTDQVPEALS